jgi:hypothetical protein
MQARKNPFGIQDPFEFSKPKPQEESAFEFHVDDPHVPTYQIGTLNI